MQCAIGSWLVRVDKTAAPEHLFKCESYNKESLVSGLALHTL